MGWSHLVARAGAVRARDLGADEAERLRHLRLRRRAVHWQPLLGLASEQRIHRLVAQLAEQVPQCEVDGADGLERQALAAVVDRRAPHAVVHPLHVARVLALDEARQVVLNDVAARLARGRDADADGAVLRLHLAHARAQRVDAPRRARARVLRPHRHRVGDRHRIDAVDPVRERDVVAVGALAGVGLLGHVGDRVRADRLDAGDGRCRHRATGDGGGVS
eukprot:4003943-Prymnesium_polylepis.2